ncbi:MAG: hypothetical protein J6J83_03125 [Oscillospiraceae bacterium]|nr:hypothetical protein [Oscillospiraceae bacterium]
MKLSKKDKKRMKYRRNMSPPNRFALDFYGQKLFAADHPWLHLLVSGLQWLVFALPLAVYVILTMWKAALNGAWGVLSVLGALFLGMGLASLIGALRRACWGVVPTVLFLGLGQTLFRTSLVMQYDPAASGLISQNMVAHYFVTYIFLMMALPFYGVFRSHIHSELRRTLREGEIRKWTKGMRNYWWYEELREQVGDTPQFGLNKAFTLMYLVTLAAQALAGWSVYGATMTNEMLRVLYALLICMEGMRCIQTHRRYFGRIVLLRKDDRGKWHSVFFSLFIIAILVLIAGGHSALLHKDLPGAG